MSLNDAYDLAGLFLELQSVILRKLPCEISCRRIHRVILRDERNSTLFSFVCRIPTRFFRAIRWLCSPWLNIRRMRMLEVSILYLITFVFYLIIFASESSFREMLIVRWKMCISVCEISHSYFSCNFIWKVFSRLMIHMQLERISKS